MLLRNWYISKANQIQWLKSMANGAWTADEFLNLECLTLQFNCYLNITYPLHRLNSSSPNRWIYTVTISGQCQLYHTWTRTSLLKHFHKSSKLSVCLKSWQSLANSRQTCTRTKFSVTSFRSKFKFFQFVKQRTKWPLRILKIHFSLGAHGWINFWCSLSITKSWITIV